MASPRYEDDRLIRDEDRRCDSEVARLEQETIAYERSVARWSDARLCVEEPRDRVFTNSDLLESIRVTLEVCDRMLASRPQGTPEYDMLTNVQSLELQARDAVMAEPVQRAAAERKATKG
ncbi:MAG TPA: hypothetical protein VGG48_00815 [Rhizomicrobium sp.]|jgi:hypothetical protein